jgi:hypothetical protein
MNTNRTARCVAAALAAGLLALAAPSFGATYKWIDEKGVVHYTDKLPETTDKPSVELNKQGVPIRRIEPPPSAEQRRAKAAEDERQKQLTREREVVDRRDRALMQSYTSENEIDLARTRALATIDTQVQSAQAYSVQLTKRRKELEAQRKTFGDKSPPPAFEREMESIDSELAKQDVLIAEKKRETAAVTARYDADKQRWRELRAISDAKEGNLPKESGGSGSLARGTAPPPSHAPATGAAK